MKFSRFVKLLFTVKVTRAIITNDTSSIFSTSNNNDPQMSMTSLIDGIFSPFPLAGSPKHCYGTQDGLFTESITIYLSDMTLIETVLIVANESNASTAATLNGAQLMIGDRSITTNKLCKQLTKSGLYTCSMVGMKIILASTGSLNICQIRAYSWKPDTTGSIFTFTTSQVRDCGDNQTVKLFSFPQPTTLYPWLDGFCYPFKNLTIFFNTVRYLHVFLLLGSNAESYSNSVNWTVQFYNSQHSLVQQSQYATSLDKYGREIIVQKLVSQIKITVMSSDLWLLYAASFSTPTDCSEAFDWAPSGDIVRYVDKTPKVESVQVQATVNAGACPLAHEAFQADGCDLPGFITYNNDLKTFNIQINDRSVVGTHSVKVRAIYGYIGGVSNKRSDYFYTNIIIKCATGIWLSDANQTQVTVKMNQSYQMPQLSHSPAEANVDYVFQCSSSLIQINGNLFSVKTSFNGQQTIMCQVTETISAITQTFNLVLTYQLCISVQDFQISSSAVVLDAINQSASVTYQAEFLDNKCNFLLTYAKGLVSQASFQNRQSVIPRDDGMIFWADTTNFSLAVTIEYDVQIVSSPHSLNGYYRNLMSNTSQLGWQLSTEGTSVMFFNNLASNTLVSFAAQSLSPMQTNRTYFVKVIIGSDRAELYLDGSLYYYCVYSPGQILAAGRIGFERQEKGAEFGSSLISNFHHLYDNPQIIQVSINPPIINFQAIYDQQIHIEENVIFTMTDLDRTESKSLTVNVKKTDLQCKVTSIVFAGQITTPLVCQLHQQCSFQLPTVQQTPSCGHSVDVYLQNAPNDDGLHSHSFVSLTEATINAYSDEFSVIGLHSFTIMASWYYDSNVRVAVPFQINMVCSDAEFAFASQVQPQFYLVYEQLQVTLPVDKCKNELDYEVQIMSYSGTSFVSVSGNITTIQSNDPDIAGSYTMNIVARKKSNPAQTLSQNFSLSVECRLNNLSFDLEATPSQVNLVEQKVNKLPFVTIKGNGCPTPAISFTTSFVGQGVTIVDVVDTNAKLSFNADFLVHMQTYSIGVAVHFDDKEFTHTYAVQVIKCGAPMTAEAHNFSLAAFVGLPIKFLLPTLNDTLQILKSDQSYCGTSTVSVTGDILTVASFDPTTQTLDVSALTNDRRGLYSGSYQRVFQNLTLTLPISIFVQQSMVFQGAQLAATFQLMQGSLALVYRDVTITAAVISQLKSQLDYLQPNEWFSELQRLQQNNLETSELLMQSLFSGLAFTHKVSSSQSDFASVIKAKDNTAFSFYDEAYADVGRHQAITQETTILRQGKPMGTISGLWGQVSVAFDFDCTTLKLLSPTAIQNPVVKVGGDSTTLNFFDLTDLDGVIAKYPQKCGKQTQQLTMSGTDDPVPSFITLGTNTITISSNKKEDVGTYEIDLKQTISKTSLRLPFQLTVTEDTSKLDPRAQINNPPVLKDVKGTQLPGTSCRIGEKCEIQLPAVVDPDGDEVSVKIEMGHGELNAANVLQYDRSTNIVSLTLPSNFKDTSEMMYVKLRDSLTETQYLMSISIILQLNREPTDETSPDKSEPSIELKKQDQIPEFLKELLNPQSLRDKQAIKSRAKTECVPSTTKVTATGQIDFIFSQGVNLQMNKDLLTKVKQAGSIQLQIIKADEGKLSGPTDFSWTFKQFNSFTIRMELLFDNAQQISATSYGRDTLRVVFVDTSQFISCDDIFKRRSLSPMPKDFQIFVTLPPQKQMLIREDGEAALAEAPSGAEILTQSNAVQSTFMSSLIANYGFGLSSQMLWGGINAMQVICVSALLQVTLPGNTQPLYSYIQSLTSFDFYNPIDTLSKWFGFSETDPYSDNFDSLGFGSINYYDSMGGLIIIIASVTLFQVLAPLLQCCKKKTQPYVRNRTGYVCNVLFINITDISIFKQNRFDVINEWLRFLEETYLDLLIAGVLSCHEILVIEEKTKGDRFDIASGIVTLVLCAGFTVFALIYATCLSRRLVFKVKAENNIERIKDIIQMMENQQEQIAENLADDAFELSHQLIPQSSGSQPQTQQDVLHTERGLLDVEDIEIQVVNLSQLKFDHRESVSNSSIQSPQLLSAMQVGESVSVINVGRLSYESKSNKSILKLKGNFTERQGVLMPAKSYPIHLYQESQVVSPQKKSVQWHAPSLISARSLEKKAVSYIGAAVDFKSPIQGQESRIVSQRSMRPRRVTAKSNKSHKPSFIDKESVLLRPLQKSEKHDALANTPSRQLSSHFNQSFKSKRSRHRSTKQAKKISEKTKKMVELMYSNGPTGRIKFLEEQLDKQTKLLKAEQAKKPFWFNYEYAKIFHEDLQAGKISTMIYHPFFLLRRAMLLWAVFQFNEIPHVQCIIFLVSSMIMVTYLVAAQPFESTKVNVIEILNESIVLLIAYYYLILNHITLNVGQMAQMGTVINSTIGVCLLGNLALMFSETIQGLRIQLKKIFEFFRMRRRAKVQDGDEGVVSNRFFQISSRNKQYFAFYPMRDVPEEDDLNWLFDLEGQQESRDQQRLLLRKATKLSAAIDFVQGYCSEDDHSGNQPRISLHDHEMPERWSAEFSSSHSKRRSRPNLPWLNVSISNDSVFPSDIQIQIPETENYEASRRNVDTPVFFVETPVFNNPSPIAQKDIKTMKQNSKIPLSSFLHRELELSKQSFVSAGINMRHLHHQTLSQLLQGRNSSIRNQRQANSVRQEIFNQLTEESSSLASSVKSSFNTNKYEDESAVFPQPDEPTVNYYGDALNSSIELQDQEIAQNLDVSGGRVVVRETPDLMQPSADSLSEQSFSLLEIAEAASHEEEEDSNQIQNGRKTVSSLQIIECLPDQVAITTEQPQVDGPDIFKIDWYNRPVAHSVVTSDPDVQADEEAQHPQKRVENSKLNRVIGNDGDEPDVEDLESLKMESSQRIAVMPLDVVTLNPNPSRLSQDSVAEQQRQSSSSGWFIVQTVTSYARSLMARQSVAQQETWSILSANNDSRQPSSSALPANNQKRPDI